jgi:NAD(P)-dependent dehydrogenase (short-subunit alcohol dehydrogenase family)
MKNKFSGKVAVITGSSRGIGKAIAVELAKNGASIVLNGRNEERLNIARQDIERHSKNVISVCCDVSIPEEAKRLIRKTIDAFGHLDILINNVGISMRGYVADLNPEVFQMVFRSNIYGTVNPTIPAIPELRKTKGSIVFISSIAGIRGLPALSAYSASKMALRAIAESIRIEEHKHKIHVGLIYVGMTEIVHKKEAIAPDGSTMVLMDREKGKVQTIGHVARAVLRNLRKRKFITTLTPIGKLNKFLQAVMPSLVEKIILGNLQEFEKRSR